MGNIFIIGASSGIGKQLALQLAAKGHQVYGTYNTKTEIEATAGLHWHHMNVMEPNIDVSFLPDELHGFVYCPGAIVLKPFARIKAEEYLEDYKLQVLGAITHLQAVLPKMKAAGSASVVFFSTVAVQTGFNFHSVVSSSKGALEGLTRALSAELAPTIRVNCVAPSITQTPLAANLLSTPEKVEANAQRHPLKTVGQAADIANAAAFLLGNESSWMTGQILHVDGGISTIK